MTMRGQLVLVTGAGRSGTSTVTGALARLGFAVPQPVIRASEANPRGFYESWWPVRFHNTILSRAALAKSDGQPDVADLVDAEVRATDVEKLQTWLGEQFDGVDRVVVKDPRAAVLTGLWADAAARVGVDIGYVAMLRHPSEVIGSRAAYYEPGATPSLAQASRIATAWLSHNLTLEQRTRDQSRAFVQYADLLADWRATLGALGEVLGLRLDALADEAVAADVDAFVEPSLRRHRPTWEGIDLPRSLRVVVEDAWSALTRLSGSVSRDRAAEDDLDEIAARFARLYAEAEALTSHRTATRVETSLRRDRAEGFHEETPNPADDARAAEEPAPAGSLVGRLRRRIRRGRSS